MIIRRGHNRAAVALANKIARIAWAVVYRNEEYNANFKLALKNKAKDGAI